MADDAAVVEEGAANESPLVEVTFQKNLQRAQKFLEGEPNALGITQICFSLFQITCTSVYMAKGLNFMAFSIPFIVASILVVIAGCVAVAAQSLHLPTLRACLGMQTVSCVACVFNLFFTMTHIDYMPPPCWTYNLENSTVVQQGCRNIERAHINMGAEMMIVQATLIAISATLAAYSCKVVNCCSPVPKMTVITVQAPAVQQ